MLDSLGIIHIIIIALSLVVFVYAVVLYNTLVSVKNQTKKAWSNIDVLLKQRHEELPKLVATCKKYMEYEQSLLERITQIRSAVETMRQQGDVQGIGQSETDLRGMLGKLFALAENYPDLKADSVFLNLQARISSLENAIADRRELYNESATINNIRIEQFPDVIVAKIGNFHAFDLLEFTEEEIGPVDVNALFDA